MNSMTGYGKGIVDRYERKVTIEMKSVNHRFLDLLFKLPRGFQYAEDIIRKEISSTMARGHIEVYLTYEDNRQGKNVLALDHNIAESYIKISQELAQLGYKNDMSVATALRMPDIVKATESDDDENIQRELIVEAARLSIANLTKMRATEGEKLVCDLYKKIDDIEANVLKVKERAPLVAISYREKLTQRIQEALSNVEIDQNKLASEVAFFVDRSNIDEELTRLQGHIAHYREILAQHIPVGKQLDFLTQEANREVNTIGSKSNDADITKLVLELKNQVEMVREQIQNLE